MNDKQQIEEMEYDLTIAIERDCYGHILPRATAGNLYAMDYRKIDKDSVVLTKEEAERFRGHTINIKKERKETVREFAERFKQRLYNYKTWGVPYKEFCEANVICGEIDELAKQYGVEVE